MCPFDVRVRYRGALSRITADLEHLREHKAGSEAIAIDPG